MTTKNGYIYILYYPYEPSEPIKIGRSIDAEGRSKQLNSQKKTASLDKGDYEIAYDEWVSDCVEVEKLVFEKLSDKRPNKDRELFNLSLRDAIKAVREVIDLFNNRPKIDFSDSKESEFEKQWNSLSFNLKRLIRFHLDFKTKFTEKQIIESLRNIIDYSIDNQDRKLVLDLYQQMNYLQNIRQWYDSLKKPQQKKIQSYSSQNLTNEEVNQIENLSSFEGREKSFITEIKSLNLLKNLEILDLSHTKITDLAGIEYFKKLTKINIDQTQVSHLKPLLKLEFLKEISCIGSKIDSKDLDYFGEFKKDCSIITKSFMG